MTLEELGRVIERLSDRVKLLEDESNSQELRIYDLEQEFTYLQVQIDDLNIYKEDKIV